MLGTTQQNKKTLKDLFSTFFWRLGRGFWRNEKTPDVKKDNRKTVLSQEKRDDAVRGFNLSLTLALFEAKSQSAEHRKRAAEGRMKTQGTNAKKFEKELMAEPRQAKQCIKINLLTYRRSTHNS